MNLRERFLEVMRFNPDVHSVKWEFGYWGETVKNWYAQGLAKANVPYPTSTISTPTTSLYTTAWTCQGKEQIPNGTGVLAGGLYWPTQGFPLDSDVRNALGMDGPQRLVDVNLLFDPVFEIKVLEEDETSLLYVDLDGVTRKFLKSEATIPTFIQGAIRTREDWEKLKAERLRLDNLSSRFPKNWPELLAEYRNRDFPLALGGYPHGFFGTLAHLLGYETLFYWYHLEKDLVHDILNTFTNLWIAVYEEILGQVEIDHLHIWEDVSAGKGPMISPATVTEFMLPYYKRIIDFLKSHGVEIILVDTDGDCNILIPMFVSVGVTGMYPFETHCGMDIVKVRRDFPRLQMCGGIPKSEIAKGGAAVDRALEPVEQVLKTGGYIPFGDHFIPPDVPWESFTYYRRKLNTLIDKYGS